jgi:uncharacterized protein YnzC (UPF0291/DUF896 family)
MPWKMSADGKSIEIGTDGNPIFVYPETNEEAEVNFDSTLKKISQLNNEAKTHRLKAAELEEQLNAVSEKYGSIDVEKAQEALKTLKALDKGELMTASKVKDFEKQLRDEIGKAYEGRIQEMSKTFETEKQKYSAEIEQREREIQNSIIDKHLQDSIASGALGKKTILKNLRLAKGYLGSQFRIENEDGKRKIVAVNWNSDRPIMSMKPEKAGEPAEFEEALNVLFNNDPAFDTIAADLHGGTGSTGGGGKGGSQAMSTQEFMSELFKKAKK